MRLFVSCVVILCTYGSISAQKMIIYTDDVPYLMPSIETIISSFKKNDSTLFFEKVVNISRVLENLQDEQAADDIRSILAREKSISVDFNNEPSRLKLSEILSDYDYFLKININPLVELLEYQFTLYSIIESSRQDTGLVDSQYYTRLKYNLNEPLNSISFFINPKSERYLEELNYNLRKLFPESNSIPVINIHIDANKINRFYRVAVGKELIIDASKTVDLDNNLSELEFHWSVSNLDSLSTVTNRGIGIRQTEPIQEILFSDNGLYKIVVKATDGISHSDEVAIFVLAVEKPLVFIPYPTLHISEFKSKWNENVYEDTLDIINLNYRSSAVDFKINRASPKELTSIERKVVDHYEMLNSDSTSHSKASSIEYPNVVEIRKKKDKDNLTRLILSFKPRDLPKRGKYEFAISGNFLGVPGDQEKISIKYRLLGNSIGIQSKFMIFRRPALSRAKGTIFDDNINFSDLSFDDISDFGHALYSTNVHQQILFAFNKGKRLNFNLGLSLNRFKLGKTYTDIYTNDNIPDDILELSETDTIAMLTRSTWKTSLGTPSFRFAYRFLNQLNSTNSYMSVFGSLHFLGLDNEKSFYDFPNSATNQAYLDEVSRDIIEKYQAGPATFNFYSTIGLEVNIMVFNSKFKAVYSVGYTRALGTDGVFIELGLHRFY